MQTQEPTLVTPEKVEPNNTQSWRTIIQPWWKATLSILPIFLLTRFLFLLLAYLGGVLFSTSDFSSVSYHDLLADWNRGDVTNYISIASNGYTKPEQSLLFPLYPALIRALAPLFGHSMLSAGFFLSNLAFLGVLIVLYRLVETEFDHATAQRAALYLAVFPTAFVFFIAYCDALFLLFALASLYAMRRSSWWLAGLFGTLATLTQFGGIFLFVAFLYEFVRQRGTQMRQDKRPLGQRVLPALGVLASLLIPFALTLYFIALRAIFHDPFLFIHTQAQYSAGISSLFTALKALIRQPHFSIIVAHNILDLTAVGLSLLTVLLCFFGPERLAKSQWSLSLFGLLLLLSALFFSGSSFADNVFSEPLALMPRLLLSIFPICIVLARFGRRAWFHQYYLLLALPMLAFFVLQFITGNWTF